MPADAKKLCYRLQNRTPFHPLRVGNAGDDSVDCTLHKCSTGPRNTGNKLFAGVKRIS